MFRCGCTFACSGVIVARVLHVRDRAGWGRVVVLDRDDEVSWLSLRNVPRVHLLVVDQLNTYDVLVSDDVIFTKDAFDAFVAGPVTGKGAKAVATESEAETLVVEEPLEIRIGGVSISTTML